RDVQGHLADLEGDLADLGDGLHHGRPDDGVLLRRRPAVLLWREASRRIGGLMTDAKWYLVHTRGGYEKRVAETVKDRAEALGFGGDVLEVVMPMSGGRPSMPGYVLLHLRLTEGCMKVVKGTPHVTGFVGSPEPQALSQDEVDRILS